MEREVTGGQEVLTPRIGAEQVRQAAEVLRMLYQRAYDDPEAMHDAPHHMPIGRPDEVKAARHPVLRWKRA